MFFILVINISIHALSWLIQFQKLFSFIFKRDISIQIHITIETNNILYSVILVYISASQWATVALSMIGKCGVSATFGIVFIYTPELFPTNVRSFITGCCNTGARIGTLISPYIVNIVSVSDKNDNPVIHKTCKKTIVFITD